MNFTGAIRKTHLLPILLIVSISSTSLLSFHLYNRQGFQQSTPTPTLYIEKGEEKTIFYATAEFIMAVGAFIAAVIIAIGIYLEKISPYVGGGIITALVGGTAIAMVIRERAKAQKARSRRRK